MNRRLESCIGRSSFAIRIEESCYCSMIRNLWFHASSVCCLPICAQNKRNATTLCTSPSSKHNDANTITYMSTFVLSVHLIYHYYQFEILDEDDNQLSPPGFHLIPLPFADDLRHLDLSASAPDKEGAAGTNFNPIESSQFECPILHVRYDVPL